MNLNSMKAAAVAYAMEGWAVFPCHPGTKDGQGKSKHPLIKDGFKVATTDLQQVERWWNKWPDALIGVVPGQVGAFVVDLDPKGDETPEHVLARLEAEIGCELPQSPIVSTQSGGWHLWFKKPEGVTIGNRKPCPGVDFRCDNGYVVVPPSKMRNGNSYDWEVPLSGELPDPPAKLLDAAIKQPESVAPTNVVSMPQRDLQDPGEKAVRRYAQTALDNARSEMASTTKGGRGHTLNALAFSMGKMVGAGALSEREVWAALSEAADASGLTAVDGAKERDAKIERGLKAGAADCGEVTQRLENIRREAREKAQRYAPRPPRNSKQPDDNVTPLPPHSERPPSGRQSEKDKHLERCAEEPETDIGNGRRFLHRNENRVLFVANVGHHVYDGKRWQYDETESLVRKHAHETVEKIADERFLLDFTLEDRAIVEEADEVRDELKALQAKPLNKLDDQEKVRKNRLMHMVAAADLIKKGLQNRKTARQRHAKSSAGSSKIDNMVKEAVPYITRKIDEMDEDPLMLNCENGTLHFVDTSKAGEPVFWDVKLLSHKRERNITKLVNAKYDPAAEAPNFEKFLYRMQPDDEVREFIKRYLGYCMTGLTHEQVFAFFHGGGRNGKSTLVDIVCRIIGDYSTTVPIETLAGDQKRKGGDATPDLMRLPAARLVRASEPESTMKFKEATIKSLTSDEPILIRALHKDFNEVYPSFKLIISGNHKPQIINDDNGIWRRVLLVPWSVQLPKEEVDKQLGAKLWAEREGILNWLIAGTLEYLQEGLKAPKAVTEATDEYRQAQNPIGTFLDEYVEFTEDTNDVLKSGEVFKAYDRVREDFTWPVFKHSTFGIKVKDQLINRGAIKAKSSLSIYKCVKLRTDKLPPSPFDPPSAF
jgi:putative DNA primase/helicase